MNKYTRTYNRYEHTAGNADSPTDDWSTDQNFPKRYTDRYSARQLTSAYGLFIYFSKDQIVRCRTEKVGDRKLTMRQAITPALRGDCATSASPRRICRSALLLRLRCHQSAVPNTGIHILVSLVSSASRTMQVQKR